MGHQRWGKKSSSRMLGEESERKKSIIVLPVATSLFVPFFYDFSFVFFGTPGVFSHHVTRVLIPFTFPSVVTQSLEHFSFNTQISPHQLTLFKAVGAVGVSLD